MVTHVTVTVILKRFYAYGVIMILTTALISSSQMVPSPSKSMMDP